MTAEVAAIPEAKTTASPPSSSPRARLKSVQVGL